MPARVRAIPAAPPRRAQQAPCKTPTRSASASSASASTPTGRSFPGLKGRLEGYLAKVGETPAPVRRRDRQPRPHRHAGEGARRRAPLPARGRRPHLPARHDLRPLVDRPAGGPAGRVPVIVLNLQPGGRDRLRRVQQPQGRRGDDGRVARILLGLPRPGDRERLQPRADPLPPDHRPPRRRPRMSGPRSTRGSRRRACRHVMATTASASWATTTAACSTSTPTSPSNAPTSGATWR
jgi:hypothetical protein